MNDENLKPTPFTTENQPANRGRKKGVPNRATVYKKWLATKIQIDDPKGKKGDKLTVTLLEAAALGQIESARKGNTNAWKEIQDSIHGKITEKMELDGAIEIGITQFAQAAKKIYDSDGNDNKG